MFVELSACDARTLEVLRRGELSTADPGRVDAVLTPADAKLCSHSFWEHRSELLVHTLGNTRKHHVAPTENYTGPHVLVEVRIAPANSIIDDFMQAFGLDAVPLKDVRLENGLAAPPC